MARLNDNEAAAIAKNLRTGERKLNLVAGLIRGKDVDKALNALQFSKRRIATEVKKTLESAIANAENNNGLDIDRLYVKEASVGKAFVLKRFRARAKGRASPILKPFSRLRIIVCEKESS